MILDFPDERTQLERRVAALGGIVVWPDEHPSLTPRERDVLTMLGRRQRSSLSIATELMLDVRWVQCLLRNLALKGYALRQGNHRTGGWVAVVGELALAA